MSLLIEDYAIIGDTHTAALVGRNGSIDWLCLPRFDSEACFASLLGSEQNGFWQIFPEGEIKSASRHYVGDTLVLQTDFTTAEGSVRITDCMPIRENAPEVIRLVEGISGTVSMKMRMAIRLGYGKTIPWVSNKDGLLVALAGPDGIALWTSAETYGQDFQTHSDFTVKEGQSVPFVLTYFPSHNSPPRPTDAKYSIADTISWWEAWSELCTVQGEYRPAVLRSLITLKALTYQPTGGIVAAATTSLPETLGGVRNWDYRYCWLRDATLTLTALMRGGYHEEAMAWRDWLLRAVAGDVKDLQIMYGPGGERRLDEWEVDWLSGYENSKPVRIGNAAAGQYQLDVYGEVMAALYQASRLGDVATGAAWDLQKSLIDFLETGWREPDDGIWEVRGPRRHFTHSKVMAWVAVDRAVRSLEQFGLDGPGDDWRKLRSEIHAEVLEKGYNADVGAFTQYYGSPALDASVLMIPLFGFLPASDPRVKSTIEKIESDLTQDGFVLRYRAAEASDVDGLTGREGAFLACSFWLADCLGMIGRQDDARRLFESLLGLRNDVGLLSEEYDSVAKRQVGNFPQAFSHVSLVNTASNLTEKTLEDGLPAPSVVEATRKSMLRRNRSLGHIHSLTIGGRRNVDVEGSSIIRSTATPVPQKKSAAPKKSANRTSTAKRRTDG